MYYKSDIINKSLNEDNLQTYIDTLHDIKKIVIHFNGIYHHSQMHNTQIEVLSKIGEIQLLLSKLDESGKTLMPHKKMPAFIQLVIATIDQNISNSAFGVNELCRTVNLGRTQVFRKVKAAINIPPIELIRQKRMIRATELLRSNLSIREVSEKCGYSEMSYFDRVFVQYYNMTPSEYRNKKSI